MALLRNPFNPAPVVPVIRLQGVIMPAGRIGRGGLSLSGLAGVIDAAFRVRKAKAVALVINSPGGSPVQSALIAGRIRQLAAEKQRPVYAFAEDACASGGYWLALAADEIYANPASIVGSIGVISAGFGFQDLIARIGVERRVFTAGTHKSFLDPFQPAREEDVQRLLSLQAELHAQFVAEVEARRGARLRGDRQDLFSGAFWTGAGALERGLVDGLGDIRSVLRGRFGDRVRLPVFQPRGGGWLQRRLGLAQAVDQVADRLDERALWSRYGL